MQLPLFPLPNVVLFPGAVIPLHIFEERYREMVDDLLNRPEDDRFVIIGTQLENGTTDENDISGFHKIATIGKLVHHEYLQDGRSNIVVLGFYSAEISEVSQNERNSNYRQGNVIRKMENWAEVNGYDQKAELLLALQSYAKNHRYRLPNLADHPMKELIPQLCFGLPLSTQDKLELLSEFNISKRIVKLIKLLSHKPKYIEFQSTQSQEFIN